MKVYFDSSVYGGCFDAEFEAASKELFRRTKAGWYTLVWSDVVENEMLDAPSEVVKLFRQYSGASTSEKIVVTPRVARLATEYLRYKVLPATMYNDALHVALATVYEVAYLSSWDKKHLVAPTRVLGFQQVNVTFGFRPVSIVTPEFLI